MGSNYDDDENEEEMLTQMMEHKTPPMATTRALAKTLVQKKVLASGPRKLPTKEMMKP